MVTGFQAWKAKFRHWCRKIVAMRLGKIEKCRSHHDADRVTAKVLSPSVAAAVPIKTCHGLNRAGFKRFAEYVASCRSSTVSIIPIVPQHGLCPSGLTRASEADRGFAQEAIASCSRTIARCTPCCFAVSGQGDSCDRRSTGAPVGQSRVRPPKAEVGEMASVRRSQEVS
jgi:hypothetical protein